MFYNKMGRFFVSTFEKPLIILYILEHYSSISYRIWLLEIVLCTDIFSIRTRSFDILFTSKNQLALFQEIISVQVTDRTPCRSASTRTSTSNLSMRAIWDGWGLINAGFRSVSEERRTNVTFVRSIGSISGAYVSSTHHVVNTLPIYYAIRRSSMGYNRWRKVPWSGWRTRQNGYVYEIEICL